VVRTTLHRDPLIDLLRRRTWAGWTDVLLLFVLSVLISFGSGQAHIGSWTTNDNGVVTQHKKGVSLPLNNGAFLLWVARSLLYYFSTELHRRRVAGLLSRRLDRDAGPAQAAATTRRPPRRDDGGFGLVSRRAESHLAL
jgi:hypothetical protein